MKEKPRQKLLHKLTNQSFQLLFVIAFIGLSNAGCSYAVESDYPTTGVVNVKTIASLVPGAKNAVGDGTTDDTAAIQAAADFTDNHRISFKPEGGTYLGSCPTLYFPPGHYIVSKQINLGAYSNLLSDGKAIIEQKTPGQRIFAFNDCYSVSITGLKFVSGSNQLYFSNRNLDATMIGIEACEFQNSSDYAIYTHGTWDEDEHMSANLVIARSKFINPRKVLYNVCDYAMVRDTWVNIDLKNFDADSAAFCNRLGMLMFDNMIGVPTFGLRDAQGGQGLANNGINKVRWVDNYSNFIVNHSRFGGEFGGIPIVHHFGNPHPAFPWMGQTISIENSWICSGPGTERPDSAVVTLRTGIPELIRIVGNSWLVNSPYIRNSGVDIPKYMAQFPNAHQRFKIVVEPNMAFPAGPIIPPELEAFVYGGPGDQLASSKPR